MCIFYTKIFKLQKESRGAQFVPLSILWTFIICFPRKTIMVSLCKTMTEPLLAEVIILNRCSSFHTLAKLLQIREVKGINIYLKCQQYRTLLANRCSFSYVILRLLMSVLGCCLTVLWVKGITLMLHTLGFASQRYDLPAV